MTSFMTYQHFYDLLTYFGYLQLDGYFQINALVKKKVGERYAPIFKYAVEFIGMLTKRKNKQTKSF